MLAGTKRVNSIPWVSEGGREPAHPNCLSRSVACRSARCSCLTDLPRVASPYASAGRLPRSRMRRSRSPRRSFSAPCFASSASIAFASSCRALQELSTYSCGGLGHVVSKPAGDYVLAGSPIAACPPLCNTSSVLASPLFQDAVHVRSCARPQTCIQQAAHHNEHRSGRRPTGNRRDRCEHRSSAKHNRCRTCILCSLSSS